MSLVVWLPLNGTLDNYGISGVRATNSGATVISNGKIGQCYNFGDGNASSKGINLDDNFLSLVGAERSVCAWVRPKGNHYHYSGAIISSGNWNNSRWAFCLKQDNSGITGFDSGYSSYFTTSVPVNTWTHLCVTVNNGVTKFYKNGEYIGEQSRGSGNLSSDASNTMVGRETYASGYFTFNGDICDVRVYDHCLSVKEVKEVASTLLIHYELDDEYVENTTNLAAHSKTSHNGFGIIDGNNLLSLPSASSYQTGESYVARIAKASGTPSGYCSYRKGISTTSGQPYTFSFKFKMISGSESQICGHWAGGTGQAISVSDAGNGWKYAYFTQTANASSMNLGVGFIGSGALDVLITELQFEQSNHPTPFALTTRTSSIVYDNSGYRFDAIGNGLTTSTDTPRYRHCYQFNGTNSYIEIPAAIGPVFDGNYTMCFWIKGSSDNGTRTAYFGSDSSYSYTLNIEKNSNNTLRFYNAGSPDYSVSAFSITDNEWIHVGIVKSGSSVSFYRNGTLVGSTSGVSNHSSYGITYYLGRDSRAQSSGLYFSGKMSDFRLYVTALSAGDVFDLCRTAASVDKNGRLHAYEFVEDGTKVKVEKTGVVLEGSLVEDETGKTRFGKDSSIYSTEFIEW